MIIKLNNINLWLIVGFAAQVCFFMRFLIQYILSEKKKKSVVPVSFWYLSVSGALLLLIYAIYRRDPVFIVGAVLGLFVYLRNLILIYKNKKHENQA